MTSRLIKIGSQQKLQLGYDHRNMQCIQTTYDSHHVAAAGLVAGRAPKSRQTLIVFFSDDMLGSTYLTADEEDSEIAEEDSEIAEMRESETAEG
jgi:hypothetical protein